MASITKERCNRKIKKQKEEQKNYARKPGFEPESCGSKPHILPIRRLSTNVGMEGIEPSYQVSKTRAKSIDIPMM